jgi:hypothetical protein
MLKKFVVALLITIFGFVFTGAYNGAHAITWTVANQSTIAWNAVTQSSTGTVFPAEDTISYKIYIVGETADKATAIEVGATDQLQLTITFTQEGRWLAGVKSIRIPAASPSDIQESGITWSDVVDTAAVPVPFGFIFFEAPANPGGLGPQ